MGINPIKAMRPWFLVQQNYRFVIIVTNPVILKKIVLNFKTIFPVVECKVAVVVMVTCVVLVVLTVEMLVVGLS